LDAPTTSIDRTLGRDVFIYRANEVLGGLVFTNVNFYSMVDIMIIFGGFYEGVYAYVEVWKHGGTEACRRVCPRVCIEARRYGGVKGRGRVGMETCKQEGLVGAWARGVVEVWRSGGLEARRYAGVYVRVRA